MGGCCAKPRPWFDDENVTEVVSVALEAARSSSPCKAARPFYLVHSAGREAQKNALALQRSARAAQAAGLSPSELRTNRQSIPCDFARPRTTDCKSK